MPRTQESTPSKFRKYVEEFGKHVLSTDGQVLRCQVCECELKAYQKSQVTQHVVGKKHVERVKKLCDQQGVPEPCMAMGLSLGLGVGLGLLGEACSCPCASSSSSSQPMAPPSDAEDDEVRSKRARYNADLCCAFVHADIPFWKMNNPAMKAFLERYTSYKTPDEATIRKNYLFAEYESTIAKIRKEVDGKFVYVQLDEALDKTGRVLLNVVVGQLCPDGPGAPRLLNVVQLDKAEPFAVEQLFEESMLVLWPNGPRRELVTLLLSDATPYMKAAARNLRDSLYPHMVHVTCVARDLHRACKEIREQLQEVDMLVMHGKKVFLKALNRIRKFIDVAPEISLPPEPVPMRCATWLHAATYYADNYATLCDVFAQLEDDSQSVKKVKLLLACPKLKDDLTFIRGNYSFLYEAVTRLETPGLMLTDALDIVAAAYAQVAAVSGASGRAIAEKLHALLAGNRGYLTMQTVARILANEAGEDDRERERERGDVEELRYLSPLQLASYKFAPITLFDLERSFARYKSVMRENRDRLAAEHLTMYLVVHCNAF